MSSQPSKMHGNMDSAIASVKENVGSATGNHSLQAKGTAQKAEGNAEHQAAKSKDYAEGAKDDVTGSIKDTVGSITGNRQMQAEGKASKLEGDVKRQANA